MCCQCCGSMVVMSFRFKTLAIYLYLFMCSVAVLSSMFIMCVLLVLCFDVCFLSLSMY